MARPVPKEEVRRLLDTLPDEASYENIQYHIYVQQKIDLGLDASERGDFVLGRSVIGLRFEVEWRELGILHSRSPNCRVSWEGANRRNKKPPRKHPQQEG